MNTNTPVTPNTPIPPPTPTTAPRFAPNSTGSSLPFWTRDVPLSSASGGLPIEVVLTKDFFVPTLYGSSTINWTFFVPKPSSTPLQSKGGPPVACKEGGTVSTATIPPGGVRPTATATILSFFFFLFLFFLLCSLLLTCNSIVIQFSHPTEEHFEDFVFQGGDSVFFVYFLRIFHYFSVIFSALPIEVFLFRGILFPCEGATFRVDFPGKFCSSLCHGAVLKCAAPSTRMG